MYHPSHQKMFLIKFLCKLVTPKLAYLANSEDSNEMPHDASLWNLTFRNCPLTLTFHVVRACINLVLIKMLNPDLSFLKHRRSRSAGF